MKKGRLVCGLVLLLCGFTAWSMAEQVFVKGLTAVMRKEKGPAYDVVANLVQNQSLEVLSRDGRWLKVKVQEKDGPKEGWIAEGSVSAQKVAESGGGGLGAFLKPVGSAGGASDTLAAKGVDEDVAKWAKSNNMNPAGLQKMCAERNKITGTEWDSFMADGHVGTSK